MGRPACVMKFHPAALLLLAALDTGKSLHYAEQRQRASPGPLATAQLLARRAVVEQGLDSLSLRARAGEAWISLAGGLWSTLLIREGPVAEPDFVKDDNATKTTFVGHCAQTFNVSRFAVPANVVENMCAKAGGGAQECDAMVGDLWKAYNASDLSPWCSQTFDWFEKATLPKCLKKCPALLCRTRCDAHDQLLDLEGQEEGYRFKLNQTLAQEERVNRSLEELNETMSDIEDFNRTNCSAFAADVASARKTLEEQQQTLTMANEAFEAGTKQQATAQDKYRAALKAGNETDETMAKLKDDLKRASESVEVLRKMRGELNKKVATSAGNVKKAEALEAAAGKRLDEMVAEHEKDSQALTAESEKIAERKLELLNATAALEDRRSVLEKSLAPQLKNK